MASPETGYCLRIATGPLAGAVFSLDRKVEIGRASNAAIQLVDPDVSRIHAAVFRTPSGFVVVDMLSTNGTWIGGDRIQRASLGVGEGFTIGESEFMLDSFRDDIGIGGPPADRIVDARVKCKTERIELVTVLGATGGVVDEHDPAPDSRNPIQATRSGSPAIETDRPAEPAPADITSQLVDIVVYRSLRLKQSRGTIQDARLRIRSTLR